MAQELLRHRFFKVARKTSTLVPLIERYQRWRSAGGEEEKETRNERSAGGEEEKETRNETTE